MIRPFLTDRSGHTAIEYSLIVMVGALAIVAALQGMGGSLQGFFEALNGVWSPGEA